MSGKYNPEHYQANKEKYIAKQKRYVERNREKISQYQKQYRQAQPTEIRLWKYAKQRAAKSGIPFDIEPSDIVIPCSCPILGTILTPFEGGLGTSPSLDRRVNDKGYVKGNICVISSKANNCKSDLTLEEAERLVEYMKG